jgi:transposase
VPGLAAQKKSFAAAERNNYKRAWFWRRIKQIDQLRLRFIDEAGVNTAMTRLYGRAPRGQRATESVPRNYGPQTSIISAISLNGAAATMTVEGAVDTDTFNAYVEQVLRPTIGCDDVLVLDNLTAHRASRIEAVAQECGAQVLWLAPYSPDFSPIELMWSKIKASMRAAKARTREELERALVAALKLITSADCVGWFTHCGYQVTSNCN